MEIVKDGPIVGKTSNYNTSMLDIYLHPDLSSTPCILKSYGNDSESGYLQKVL